MDLNGYVNPRSLGNSEPNQMFGMDIFIEHELWEKYIDHKAAATRDLRTYDVCWMLISQCHGRPPRYEERRNFVYHATKYGNKKLTLCAYWHPEIMALCVGLAAPDAKEYETPQWASEAIRLSPK